MRYAYVLDSENYRDHVHSAYVYYADKTGEDLFEQPLPYILRCVKFMWKWRWSNEHRNKVFEEYEEAENVYVTDPTNSIKFVTSSKDNPHQILESKEVIELIRKRVATYHSGGLSSVDPMELVQVMDYLQHGYTGREIGKKMGISEQTASNHKKKIQALIGELA